ncbi:MAG TPA: hypothetical protein VF384_15410 [Planctomycetota bacterium]
MTRRSQKELQRLDTLEGAFRERLVEELKMCAAGRNSLLFLASSMKPAAWGRIPRSEVADELLEAADEILALRSRHGLLPGSCLALRFRDACTRHVERADHHAPGARKQAEQLLREILDSQPSGGPTSRGKGNTLDSRIMFLESKNGLRGPARIGRVTFSKTGRTIRYGRLELRSLKGSGFKANYFDLRSHQYFWVSGPRRDGMDCLYPGVVEIDEDVREEYWRAVRRLPECIHLTSFRSPGKYSRRRPRPELVVHGAASVGCSRRK